VNYFIRMIITTDQLACNSSLFCLGYYLSTNKSIGCTCKSCKALRRGLFLCTYCYNKEGIECPDKGRKKVEVTIELNTFLEVSCCYPILIRLSYTDTIPMIQMKSIFAYLYFNIIYYYKYR